MLSLSIISWTKSPTQPEGYDLWMKETPINHGIVIQHPDVGPGYIGETELMSRRHSVIRKQGDKVYLQIGSIAYTTPYDSTDPAEIFNKYIAGEFEILMHAGPYDTVTAEGWDGQPNTMKR